MQFEKRLWSFTKDVRGRIAFSVLIGIIAAALGVLRLALLGWIICLIFLENSVDLISSITFLDSMIDIEYDLKFHYAYPKNILRSIIQSKRMAPPPANKRPRA